MSINIDNLVSINEVPLMISTLGEQITFVVRGEKGVGKTTILKTLENMHGDKYHYVYIDVPTIGDGDLAMRVPDRDTKNLEWYIASMLKLDNGKPVCIMLDEYLKAPKSMKPLFTRLVLERCIGDRQLPEGSIVFATSNLGTDGVGDTTQAHEGNRVTFIEIAKPTAKEWLIWAVNNGISSITRTMVQVKPQLLQSYRTLSTTMLNDNPYIFNPSKNAVTFCSPRSLAKADIIVRSKDMFSDKNIRSMLIGTVGEAAAELFSAFMLLEKDLTPIPQILKNPEAAPIPTSVGAVVMTLFNGVDGVETQDELAAFLKFVNRIDNAEYKDVFMSMLCESHRTAAMAMQNKEVMKWYEDNYKIISN